MRPAGLRTGAGIRAGDRARLGRPRPCDVGEPGPSGITALLRRKAFTAALVRIDPLPDGSFA